MNKRCALGRENVECPQEHVFHLWVQKNAVSTKLHIAQNPENGNIAKDNVGGLDRKSNAITLSSR